MKVSVIGTTGYGGGELIRILHNHPVFQIHSVHSSRDEAAITDEFPHLAGIFEHSLKKIDPGTIAEEADLVFLATPSRISGELAKAFAGKDIQVIDLSGDLRLSSPEEYEKWYKHKPVEKSIINQAVYGLSEWNSEKIRSAKIIANPGCYPTAALLGLGPVAEAGLIDPAAGIIIDAKSGVSGAGKTLSRVSAFAEMNDNFRIYKVNEHQHIPEIEQQLKQWDAKTSPITFSTHLLPLTRGIMATMYVQLKRELKTSELLDLYQETYSRHHFVRVRKEGDFPAIKEVSGSNFCDIGLHADPRTGRLTIVSVIDNLMKGAAGQAVQNANLMNGLDEKEGLGFIPIYP
ncbi:N-acetyl-gamma-glutamyl-phosphate reductase [Mesobacillus campisalis]|uniref:N-acetyl-gamma-glutamyl-phosphate reductase n=1 Tax=Mesobacillus campisalis TaxID=1408103 RepID=A0A0M2SVF7_9BACI|nr:N-acetyl-gamma-glutamyl-phosphate reductase [Mesobacillus campisalis]KKK36942.1 N-acetyl-gamma-glutamyl-phosphate reductase [Mesobacillus campisalis]